MQRITRRKNGKDKTMYTRIYRFRDKIALTPTDGPTIYLSKDEASGISQAIRMIERDIVAHEKHHLSSLGSITVDEQGNVRTSS